MQHFGSFQEVYNANGGTGSLSNMGMSSVMSVFNKVEDVEAVNTACNEWSEAIDSIASAVQEYNDARTNYRKVIGEITLSRTLEAEIVSRERVKNPDRLQQFEREYRQITDAQQMIREKVDTLNSMSFKFEY